MSSNEFAPLPVDNRWRVGVGGSRETDREIWKKVPQECLVPKQSYGPNLAHKINCAYRENVNESCTCSRGNNDHTNRPANPAGYDQRPGARVLPDRLFHRSSPNVGDVHSGDGGVLDVLKPGDPVAKERITLDTYLENCLQRRRP